MMNEDIEMKYRDVQSVLEESLEKANSVKLEGEAENAELLDIQQRLETLNIEFKNEIEQLKSSSEWDKLCVAFFGETNAGKSTIIESLRIIYDEETRRAEALSQKKKYCNLLQKHCEDYQTLIFRLQELNISLQNYRGRNNGWIIGLITGAAGVGIGLILANLGIVVW